MFINLMQSLANYFAPTLAAIIGCVTITIAAYAYQKTMQKLPANVQQQIQNLAHIVVQAIEQKYHLADTGAALKKQEAMTMLASIARSLDIPLDTTHASAAIEAAVYSLNL